MSKKNQRLDIGKLNPIVLEALKNGLTTSEARNIGITKTMLKKTPGIVRLGYTFHIPNEQKMKSVTAESVWKYDLEQYRVNKRGKQILQPIPVERENGQTEEPEIPKEEEI